LDTGKEGAGARDRGGADVDPDGRVREACDTIGEVPEAAADVERPAVRRADAEQPKRDVGTPRSHHLVLVPRDDGALAIHPLELADETPVAKDVLVVVGARPTGARAFGARRHYSFTSERRKYALGSWALTRSVSSRIARATGLVNVSMNVARSSGVFTA